MNYKIRFLMNSGNISTAIIKSKEEPQDYIEDVREAFFDGRKISVSCIDGSVLVVDLSKVETYSIGAE